MIVRVKLFVKSIMLCTTIQKMDTSRLDLNLLLTLEALLTEQNVTKAAARLHLSQPAVSAQLSRLRDLFEDPLLVPAHRGMTPTTKALELLEPLRLALDQVRQTLLSHQVFTPAEAELTVTIACSDYIQAVVIMPLVLALRQQAPGVRIAVRHLQPSQLEQQLASGELDLVIAVPQLSSARLRSRHLFNEDYVLIGRHHHPRLQNKPTMTVSDYIQLEHVIVSRVGGDFMTPVDEALAAQGQRRKVVMSAASFLFIPEIVAGSDLVALVPRRLMHRLMHQSTHQSTHQSMHQSSARLQLIDLPWLTEQFSISLIWHERNHGHAGQSWLRELIIQLCADQ